MSVLQCSNIHFESTANTRLQYDGSNSFLMVAAGQTIATVNTSGVAFTNTNLTLTNVASTTNTFTVGTASYFVANGNLGIGNSSPVHKLSVQGPLYTSTGNVSFGGVVNITTAGYVGIGNNTPTSGLVISTEGTNYTDGSYFYVTSNNTSFGGNAAFTGIKAPFSDGANAHILKIQNATGNKFILDGTGRIGLGVTPKTWQTGISVFQIGSQGFLKYGGGSNLNLGVNYYFVPDVGPVYIANGYSTEYVQDSGNHYWVTSPSGTAGANVVQTVPMILAANGNLGVGESSPKTKLVVSGGDDNTYGQLQIISTGTDSRLELWNNGGNTNTGRGTIFMSNTSGYQGMRFMTGGVDRTIIAANGNFGISTVSPKTKLHVAGAGTTLSLALGSMSTNASMYITNSDALYGLIIGSNGDGRTHIQAQRTDAQATAYDICLNPIGGNIAVGSTAPSSRLDVYNTAAAGHLTLSADDNGSADQTRIDLDYRVRNAGQTIARISSRYATSAGTGEGELRFFTKTSSSSLTERMNIDGYGRITTPYQPCFAAVCTGGNVDVEAGGPLPADSAYINVGNHYNSSNYTFTAPVYGYYLVWLNAFHNLSLTNAEIRWYVEVNDIAPSTAAGGGASPYIAVHKATGTDNVGAQGTTMVRLGQGDSIRIISQYGPVSIYRGHSGWGAYLLG